MELTKNNQPLFIGVEIIKINQHLQTSVLSKNTKASLALSESPQDSRYKRSLLKTMFDREIACLLRNIISCKKKKTTAGVGKSTEWFVKPIQYPSLTMMKLIIAVYAHIKEEKDFLPKKLQKKPFCNNIKRDYRL